MGRTNARGEALRDGETRDCKTCEGTGVVLYNCKEARSCLSGGKGAEAAHELECPCCEGSGGQP